MFKTPKLSSNLCDYSDEYIVVKEEITAEGNGTANRENKNLNFKKMLNLDHAYQKPLTYS